MSVTDRTLTGGKPVPDQRKGGAPLGTDDEPPARGGRKKKLVGAVVLLVALLGAGGGGFLMFTGGGADAAETEAAEAEPVPGAVVPLEPITINLADGRYLQVGIALQEAVVEGGGHGEEKTDGSKALDILIHHLSGKPMSELASTEQRDAVKAELVEEIRHAYHDHVYDIYFTSFVMQ